MEPEAKEVVDPVTIQSSIPSSKYGTIAVPPAHAHSNSATPTFVEVRTYWQRWGVLGIFILNQIVSNLLWITFAPVADIMRCYYGVTNDLVNTLSLVNAILTFLLVIPAAWMLVRFGIRFVMVLCSFGNALGGALRVMGTGSGHFYMLIIGQIVSSLNGVISGTSTLLSETWFPASERATATAIGGSVSAQIGVLLGYALGPSIIHSDLTEVVCYTNSTYQPTPSPHQASSWSGVVHSQIFYYLLGQAILCVLTLFVTLAVFPEAPPTPPSLSRLLESRARMKRPFCQQLKDFGASFLEFMRNGFFVLFLISAGIHIGSSGTIGSLINEMVLPHFKGQDRMIAYLGITMKVASILGLLVIGRILDWTKSFYVLWLCVYIMTAASLATFAAVVQYQHYTFPLYISIAFMGASFSSFQVVALEYAVEMTYPLPEGTSAGLLNFVAMLVSIVLIVVFGRISSTHKVYTGTWVIVGVLLVGAVIAVFVKPELKRLNIDKRHKNS